jgi:hypothetical protein
MMTKKQPYYKAPSKASFLALFAVACLLVGCGGGGSSNAPVAEMPTPTPLPNAPSTPNTPAPLIAPGAYVASLNGKDWVSMLLPTTQGNGTVSNFYGMHYNATDPDLFSGSGTIAGVNTATLSRVFVYPNISAAVRSGTGTISNLGNGVVRATLSFPSVGTEQGKDVNVAASAPSNYKYNTPASLSSVQGSWQGRWSYGFGYVDNFTLTVSGQGELASTLSFQQDCILTQGALIPNFDGTNLFTFSVTIPTATQCSLKGQTLNGAAYVTTSPLAGKSQRLYIIGVTTDGRGISYKADR